MDFLTKQQRSRLMALVRRRDTKPELTVRRYLFSLGYRFRVNPKGLPGTPDIAFTRLKKAIFVHGCFWHQHRGCKLARIPKSNRSYWEPKLARNKARDAENKRSLRRLGWGYLVLWECQLHRPKYLERAINQFLAC